MSDENAEVGYEPLRIAVVRLRNYLKGDQIFHKYRKRPYLFVLAGDSVTLFTSKDAGSGEDPAGASIDEGEPKRSTTIKGWRLGSKKRDTQQHQQQPASEEVNDHSSVSEAGDDLADDLEVFKLGVSLNQIVACSSSGDRLIISFQPNKPSKQRNALDDIYGFLYSSVYGPAIGAKSSELDPQCHHVTIQCASPQESESLRQDIDKAHGRFTEAVRWLSEDLPFLHECRPMMLTVALGPTGTRKLPQSGSDGTGPIQTAVKQHIIPFPTWGAHLELPDIISDVLVNPGSTQAQNTTITVYLSTPLGPAVATIAAPLLMRSAQEGGCPMRTVAELKDPLPANTNSLGKKKVVVVWRAEKGMELSPVPSGELDQEGTSPSMYLSSSEGLTPSPSKISPRTPNTNTNTSNLTSPRGGRRSGSGGQIMPASSDRSGGIIVLGLAAFSGLKAAMRRVRGTGSGSSPTSSRSPSPPGSPTKGKYKWNLVLIEAELTLAPPLDAEPILSSPMQRTVSMSMSGAAVSGAPLPTATAPLPQSIEMLVQQHPDILNADGAHRFLVGLESESRAYTALMNVVTYTKEQGLENLLTSSQPAFTIMKEHYQHGTLGWSKKRDCLVEVELTGVWPQAYEAIRKAGVTDKAMLEHLLFIQQYQFKYNDPRPLPHGKTVKIVDLSGLRMWALRTDAFKLISKVGALLGAHDPQRLHVCFLIRAPQWWSLVWNLLQPVIPPKVRGSMRVYNKNQSEEAKKAMLEWIDEDLLPVEYGGKNEMPLAESPFEVKLAEYVAGL